MGLMSAVGVAVIGLWGRLADGSLGVVRALRCRSRSRPWRRLVLPAAGRRSRARRAALLLAAARAPGEALADPGRRTGTRLGRLRPHPDVGQRGFAVTVGLWGLLLGRTGLWLILPAYPAACLVAVLSTRGSAPPPVAAAPRPRGRRPDRLLPRPVLVLLAGVLVFGVAMATTFTVLPLRIVDVGGAVSVGAPARWSGPRPRSPDAPQRVARRPGRGPARGADRRRDVRGRRRALRGAGRRGRWSRSARCAAAGTRSSTSGS